MTTDLTILYEHPAWFVPLFAALDRRGVRYEALHLSDHRFDPADPKPPSPVVLSRVAMSSFLREADHAIFYAEALFAHWSACGARVINGAEVIAVDRSKARQLSLIAGLGLGIPRTRIVHRAADLPAAAREIGFPLIVKANIGGSGAGIVRYQSADELAQSIADKTTPESVDRVLLVQEYIPARDGIVTRIETLDGKFLYAIDIESPADSFDLCPADACEIGRGPGAIGMTRADPAPKLIDAAERIARAARLDVGGIEVMIDDRDGTAKFYDVNALSNFVAKPLDVLGWDPHEQLVDYLEAAIAAKRT
ncbi:alpha-L-glutamate ligase [Polymorphobacter sp. PAMC 29334]|uniref:ATP-grasp domain-containing protein n=1 Tax=Polymorphobacter sp. PAMC 29334 TaxID=2862331 RepID=UPI001C7754A8|nr:alpha-L-glutamate ligase [Polymorphobacter sp. PAMC 29334]QYE36613.1 alpha-L-glutamate ligase [Polymorphobacter sp. PAMC 29334]